ncbi:MAG TPA: hypothetical protein ENJ09_06225 [Planctomycetes bacterium]|nr:hypothetical protein [Planctomycetota bacterium]
MRISNRLLPCLLATAALAGSQPQAQQNTRVVLREGQPILGAGGDIKTFNKIAVSDTGIFYANVQTTGDKSMDDVVLLNGFLSILEGSVVAAPSGATIRSFTDIDVNSQGFVGWPLSLSTGSNTNDTGIYWNTLLLALENNDVVATDVYGVPFNGRTVYNKFSTAKINDRSSILWAGNLDDKGTSGTEGALILERTDGQGTLIGEDILAMKGFAFPGQTETVKAVGINVNNIALNNNDDWIAMIKMNSSSLTDSTVTLNGQILAREGEESPIPGRFFTDFGGSKIDLNDFKDYVFTAFVDGDTSSNAMLIVNGQIYAQEGQTYPAFEPQILDRFDSVPMFIANSGDVFWYAKTLEGASTDQYLLRNQEVIVQENVTAVGNETVTKIQSTTYAYHVSKSGRFWIAEVENGNGDSMLILADFGTSYPLPGCTGNPGTLTKVTGETRAGETLLLEMDGAQGIGAIPMVFWSANNAAGTAATSAVQCGLVKPVGEIMISLARSDLFVKQIAAPYTGVPISLRIDIPNDPSLINMKVYGQGVFWDAAGTSGGPTFQLTNGYYLEIGAP